MTLFSQLRLSRRDAMLGIFGLIVAALFFAFSSQQAFAATKTWTGDGADANWSTDANWSPSGAPTNGDDLVFNLSDLGTFSAPDNDIASLSIASMSFTNGTNGQSFALRLTEATTFSGDATNTSATRVGVWGGFVLGADIDFIGGFGFSDHTSASNEIALGGHALTISDDASGITSFSDVPITGTGTVNYDTLGDVQVGSVNTYSGTTNITNINQIYNSTSDPQSPTEMFGSSSIVVDASSTVHLVFTATETFSNQITLAATEVSGSSFNAQLNFNSSQVSAAHVITVPNVILSGAGGMTLSPSGIASVNLAGMTTNGNCLYVPTVYVDNFLNVGDFCGASNASLGDDVVPGVPNTGEAHGRSALPLVILASVAGLAGAGFIARRYLLAK